MLPGGKKGMVSIMDMTECKRTEETLRNLQERYNAILESASEAIFVIQEGLMMSSNKKFLGFIGCTEDELISKPFKEFIHQDDQNIFQLYLQKIEHQERVATQGFRLIHRNGHILFAETRGTLIHWEGKGAVLNFMTDITERKRAEEELWNSIKPFRSLVNAVEKRFLHGMANGVSAE
jgi:PAS domain S-box-containing protein